MVWHNVAMRQFLSVLIVILFVMAARATEPAPFILIDQLGHLPKLEKRAVSRDPIVEFDAARSFSPRSTYAVIDTKTG